MVNLLFLAFVFLLLFLSKQCVTFMPVNHTKVTLKKYQHEMEN